MRILPIDIGKNPVGESYQEARSDGSPRGAGISQNEYDALLRAWQQTGAGINLAGVQITTNKRREFMQAIVGEDPALAEAILSRKSYPEYVGARVSHQLDPMSLGEDAQRLARELGLQAGEITSAVGEQVAERQMGDAVRTLRENARAYASELDSPGGLVYGQAYTSYMKTSPEAERVRAEIAELGVRDVDGFIAKIED